MTTFSYDRRVLELHRVQEPETLERMMEAQTTLKPVKISLYEHERRIPWSDRFVAVNPWLHLCDVRGPGEGTYQWHKDTTSTQPATDALCQLVMPVIITDRLLSMIQ